MSKGKGGVDSVIKQAIADFGDAAVREATQRLTRLRRGPRKIADWPKLEPFLQNDISDWLEDLDPIAKRSNHSIASKFAEAHPGQSKSATLARVRDKLRKQDNRKVWGLSRAIMKARSDQSALVYLRLLEQIITIIPGEPWTFLHESADRLVSEHSKRNQLPTGCPSIEDLEAKANPIKTGLLCTAAPLNKAAKDR